MARHTEHVLIGSLYAVGLLAFVLGIVFQFLWGGDALLIALLVFLFSRGALGLWQVLRPRSFEWRQRSRLLIALLTIAYTGFAIIISIPLWT